MKKYNILNIFLSVTLILSVLSACAPAADVVEPDDAEVMETETMVEEPEPTMEEPQSKGLIVAFQHSSTNNFVAEIIRGLKEQAISLGYDIKVYEDNFDQAEQDVLVQQALTNEENIVGFIWDPADEAGATASLKALHDTGLPVVQLDRMPLEEQRQFLTAYAGFSDFQAGQESGNLMLLAREELIENGASLSSEGGNLVAIQYPREYASGLKRVTDGFADATKDAPFNIIALEPTGWDPEAGYQMMTQVIAAYKDEGIEFVHTHNDQLAVGVIRALEEAGYSPGEDVMVVGGVCHGDLSYLEEGQQFGSNIYPAYLSGILGINVLDALINGATVVEGETYLPADPDNVPELPSTTELNWYTFLSVLGVKYGKDNVDSATLWGVDMRTLCSY